MKSLKPDSSIVGTSGKSGHRVGDETARHFSTPDLMCGAAGASEPELICTVLLSKACSASPPPLNTTSSSFGRLAANFNTAACNCGDVPIGGVETLNLSGLFCASSTNSFMFLAGNSDRTTKVLGEFARSVTAM